MSTPPATEDIEAHALNLSERGLFIETERDFSVGDTLRMRFPLGNRELDCQGLITWTRRVPRAGQPAGIGVEFCELANADLECIKSVIGTSHEHEVTVQLTGLPSPIRARAAVAGDLLSLHTELPFLRIGTVTKFALAGDADSHCGKIRRVAIEPGSGPKVPRLRIDIAVLGAGELSDDATSAQTADAAPAPPTSELADEHSAPANTVVVPEAAPTWVEPSAADETEQIRPYNRRWLIALPAAAVATAAIVVAAATTATASRSVFLRADIDIHEPASIRAVAHEEALFEEPPTTPTQIAAAAPAMTPEPPAPERQTVKRRLAAADNQPLSVAADGDQTTVRLSLSSGTTANLSHYLLADPDGLAITLPNATLRAAARVHETQSGDAKRVWVRRLDDGSQVRIFFPDKGPRSYRVSATEDTITAVIESAEVATPSDE